MRFLGININYLVVSEVTNSPALGIYIYIKANGKKFLVSFESLQIRKR